MTKHEKNTSRAGFEPARGDPIGFRVQRLNHSAIVTCYILDFTKYSTNELQLFGKSFLLSQSSSIYMNRNTGNDV